MSGGHDNMSFLEHLEELRWHIIRSLIAIISVGFVFLCCHWAICSFIIR